MFLWILITVGILLAVFAVALAISRRKYRQKTEQQQENLRNRSDRDQQSAPSQTPFLHTSPDQLEVGDRLRHPELGSVEITGRVVYDEAQSWRWYEFYVNSGTTRQWFSAEQNEDTKEWQFALWTEVEGDFKERPKDLTHDSIPFERKEEDKATYRATGTHNLGQDQGVVEYGDYEEVDGERLFAIERYNNGSWEASIGIPIESVYLKTEH